MKKIIYILLAVLFSINAQSQTTYATWNPSDKGTVFTLSNVNKTITQASTGNGLVRATIGKSSGKWYWEVVTTRTTDYYVGIANVTPDSLTPLRFIIEINAIIKTPIITLSGNNTGNADVKAATPAATLTDTVRI